MEAYTVAKVAIELEQAKNCLQAAIDKAQQCLGHGMDNGDVRKLVKWRNEIDEYANELETRL